MDSSPILIPIALNVIQKDDQRLLSTSPPFYAHFQYNTSEAQGCPGEGVLPELAFLVSLEVCLGCQESFLYTSQDLSVLELLKWEWISPAISLSS